MCVFHEFEFMPISAGRFRCVHFGKLTSIVFAIQGETAAVKYIIIGRHLVSRIRAN